MKIREDFKIVDKDKIIGICIIAFISIAGLGNWIATSFGTMDEDMSATFYKAMGNAFMRGFDAWTILDGYIVILTWGFPLAILLMEYFFKGFAKRWPNSWWARHQNLLIWGDVLVGIVYAIILFVFAFTTDFKSIGMDGVYNEFITGPEYIIPIFVVDIILNYAIFIALATYIHKVVAKRKDFLEIKAWRRLFVNAFFIIFGYVMILALMKRTFQRPYWFNIHWNDPGGPAEKFREWYPKQYDHYLHQTEYNWGWTQDAYVNNIQGRIDSVNNSLTDNWLTQSWGGPQNWKWWMGGKGWVQLDPNNIPMENAFPSGHMVCLASVATNMLFYYDLAPMKDQRKKAKYRWFVVALLILYYLDMAFTLETSTSHWWSDITFSMFIPPIAYWMAQGIVYPSISAINKHWNLSL